MCAFQKNVHNVTHTNQIDDEVFVEIYDIYYKNLYNYVCFRINNHYDAEDLVSTVFVNVIKRFSTYNPDKASLEAWLVGIAKNVVNDYLRSRMSKKFVSVDNLLFMASPYAQPDQLALQNEEYRVIMNAMSRLKEKDRQVLSMKFVTELKNTEIAGLLGISESNVAVSIHRSLKRLKKLVEKEGGSFA